MNSYTVTKTVLVLVTPSSQSDHNAFSWELLDTGPIKPHAP
jgi:hypothetical protein